MELAEEIIIPAPMDKVYEGLNDVAILKACIPGCEALVGTGENALEAKVTMKIGHVKAKFKGAVSLSDIDPPNGYTISGEGKGGPAGFAKGGATVKLAQDGDEVLDHRPAHPHT